MRPSIDRSGKFLSKVLWFRRRFSLLIRKILIKTSSRCCRNSYDGCFCFSLSQLVIDKSEREHKKKATVRRSIIEALKIDYGWNVDRWRFLFLCEISRADLSSMTSSPANHSAHENVIPVCERQLSHCHRPRIAPLVLFSELNHFSLSYQHPQLFHPLNNRRTTTM